MATYLINSYVLLPIKDLDTYTTINHGFLRGSNSLLCHFLLMNMYILTGQGLELHMYFLIDQLDYSGLFD
jgi:hypothetical protein